MRVGILGTGDVGRALGTGFAGLGHEVGMGSRDAQNARAVEWAAGGGRAGVDRHLRRRRYLRRARGAGHGVERHREGPAAGRRRQPRRQGGDRRHQPARLRRARTTTGAGPRPHRLRRRAGAALAPRGTGGQGVQHRRQRQHGDPDIPGGPPDMFFCGNDEEAKAVVAEILAAFGWPSIDIGGIEGARVLEPMCILWVIYGGRTGTWVTRSSCWASEARENRRVLTTPATIRRWASTGSAPKGSPRAAPVPPLGPPRPCRPTPRRRPEGRREPGRRRRGAPPPPSRSRG